MQINLLIIFPYWFNMWPKTETTTYHNPDIFLANTQSPFTPTQIKRTAGPVLTLHGKRLQGVHGEELWDYGTRQSLGEAGYNDQNPKVQSQNSVYDLPERHLHTISAKFNCLASNLRENIIRCFFSVKRFAANTSQQHPCGKRMPHARERQRKVMVEFDPLRNPFAPTWGNTQGKNVDLKNLQPWRYQGCEESLHSSIPRWLHIGRQLITRNGTLPDPRPSSPWKQYGMRVSQL